MNNRPETTISQRECVREMARIRRDAEVYRHEVLSYQAHTIVSLEHHLISVYYRLAAFDAPDAALYRADWHGHDVKVEVEEDDDTDGFTVAGVYLNGAEISEAIATEDLWKIESAVRYQREMEVERAKADAYLEAQA